VNETKDFIFGIHPVTEAIRAGKNIDRILIKQGLNSEIYREAFGLIRDSGVPFQFVRGEALDRITRKNHQGVIAFLLPVELQDTEQIIPMIFESGKNPFILALDSITDVRNFGSISRSAECVGVDAILVPEKNSARLGSDAVRTSAGALHHLNVCRTKNLATTLKYLRESGLQIVAATEKGQQLYHQTDFTRPTVIVMGSEDTGISDEILKLADALVQIPIRGKVGSLNVSVAAGILMYEVDRQRNN
jgi:23S rRNA (guanosine2251-2'-O)-methyltransferase